MDPIERQQKRLSYTLKFALFHFLLNPVLLFFGFWAAGAGHGDSRLWKIAIISCFLFSLTLLMTTVMSFPLRKLDIEQAFLFYAFLILFLTYGSCLIWIAV